MARPRDERIDRAIVDACVELLSEVGRTGMTRELIARRAGVSLPAVTRRFASVDDVVLAVASTPYHRPHELAGGRTLREHLVASARRTARTMGEADLRRSASELLAAAAGDERIDAAFAASLRSLRAQGLAVATAAREVGEVADDVDPEVLLDLVNGALYYRLLWRAEVPSEDEAERMVDVVLDGARPRPS